MTTLNDIRNTVLTLPSAQRAELAHDLLASLEDAKVDADCDVVWADEVLARSDAYRCGEATARDWRQSVERVRQALDNQGSST